MPSSISLTQAPARHDAIVSLLYDGVTCSGDWYDALDTLRAALGAACFHNFTVRRDTGMVVGEGLGNLETPTEKLREYELHHCRHDRRMDMTMTAPVGVVVADHEYLGERAMSRSQIYADWLRKAGLRYTLAMSLRADEETREVLGIVRAHGDAHFEAGSLAFSRRVAPHLARASELRARMHKLASHAAIGLSALDGLPQGIAVLEATGQLQYFNRQAESHTSAGGPCEVVHGRLLFRTGQYQSGFLALLHKACGQSGPATGGAMRVPRASGTPLDVSVLPLKASHPLASFRQQHLALVVFTSRDTDAVTTTDPRALAQLLGLTPAESRLALLLAAGKTVKDFALVQQCAEHTARYHLKNLLRKSGCHRQVELVRLVQSMRLG
ncbi:helix-turn-helix transcriptional regulator [Variovorax sp. EL159]|uniref:helix-turn-helix transcriptional regulator n=1 Tax=Variovorax sp. EL159 TaxID=1566270 RepID=UPI00088E17CA|nr:helix-turn-helix transcriptional regulator [Variovorax sp. EL159]SCX73495.1 DNA-binding transcriptional regulator, CsgD family [Variovorax sp. EL159]